MKVKENNIIVERTARYYLSETTSREIKSLWFVIHGYGQLAKDFINEFDFLSGETNLIVAPEGLSKFYSRDKIGASWMTREDRLNEISDYLNYLNEVMKQIENNFDLSKAKSNLLGYSQGVHTAVRFFTSSSFNFDKLILCSSDFPKDADFVKLKSKSEKSKIFFIYGTKDEIITQETYEGSMKLLKENKINFEEITFKEGHEIHKDSFRFMILDL